MSLTFKSVEELRNMISAESQLLSDLFWRKRLATAADKKDGFQSVDAKIESQKETIQELQDALEAAEEHSERIVDAALEAQGGDWDSAITLLEAGYSEHDTAADYARDSYENCHDIKDFSIAAIINYVDWDEMGRDMLMDVTHLEVGITFVVFYG